MPHPLHVPELLRLVLVSCSRQSLARLSLVSKSFFDATIPYLWEYVTCDTVQLLSLMIKGTTYDNGFWRSLVLPKKILHENFCRFSIYAKFIKHLELKISESRDIRSVRNSLSLLDYADSNTILPRLQSFTIESYFNSNSRLDWAAALFSSSLLEIRCKPSEHALPPLSINATSLWLKHIAIKCPNLETLELHPYSNLPDMEIEGEVPSWRYEEEDSTRDSFTEPLSRLKQLRALRINTHITGRDHMKAISSLPNLERLGICTSHHPDSMLILRQADLTENSFPMLRCLELCNLLESDMDNIWQAESLIQKLQSLCLVLNPLPKPGVLPNQFGELGDWLHFNLIPKFSQLTHLTLILEFSENGEIEAMDEAELSTLLPLSLEYFSVRGAQVYPNSEPGDDGDEIKHPCELLASLWPNIQELHWPDQPAASRDLIYFAALPHLRRLTLNMKLMPTPQDIDNIAAGPDTFEVLKCSKPKSFRSTSGSRKQAARQASVYLSSILSTRI
ncbi:hypothetical protein FRC12_005803 [Ceratobasidium sp. 428]|nr:hypothetical protein FRC12_005803 [Ceratobasidium sp. 428]